jgi:glycosyltransferase involved in cell wall biosynthesis
LPQEPVVGMVGSMFYPPNVRAVHWFGRYVWPVVKGAIRAARWLILGRRPTRSVRRWGQLPGITVTGYVPDVRPFLNETRCIINAVDNDLGVQSKLVVAMAAGRPAVITPKAAGGLVYDDPPPFVVVGSPRPFAEAVIRVLRDDAFARALAGRARAVAEAHYGQEQVVRRLEHWLGAPAATPPRSATRPSAVTPREVVPT